MKMFNKFKEKLSLEVQKILDEYKRQAQDLIDELEEEDFEEIENYNDNIVKETTDGILEQVF